MAKRKHSAALFEVIHADKRFPNRHSGEGWTARAGNWWPFKPREKTDAAPAAPSGPPLLTRLFSLIPHSPKVGFELDPERQTVRFQMSYTAAMVAAFTVFVGVSLAYMIGRHRSHHAAPALADQTTAELREGPARPEVLDVGSETETATPPVAMATDTVPAGGHLPAKTTSDGLRPMQWTEPKAPATLVVSGSARQVGLQYVIVQTYPEEEKQLAEEAKKALTDSGVLCTVETGLSYAPHWYCVVGIDGFDRVRNSPQYDSYVAKIMQIGTKLGEKSKFKKFDPKPYKWRETKAQ